MMAIRINAKQLNFPSTYQTQSDTVTEKGLGAFCEGNGFY